MRIVGEPDMIEHIQFLSITILDFKNVGAILPSSRFLAQRMARIVAHVAEDGDMIFELGPGTGVITKEILRQPLAPGLMAPAIGGAAHLNHVFAST